MCIISDIVLTLNLTSWTWLHSFADQFYIWWNSKDENDRFDSYMALPFPLLYSFASFNLLTKWLKCQALSLVLCGVDFLNEGPSVVNSSVYWNARKVTVFCKCIVWYVKFLQLHDKNNHWHSMRFISMHNAFSKSGFVKA